MRKRKHNFVSRITHTTPHNVFVHSQTAFTPSQTQTSLSSSSLTSSSNIATVEPEETEERTESADDDKEATTFFWTDKALSRRLIDLHQEFKPKFTNGRYRKKKVWEMLAKELNKSILPGNPKPTAEQCTTKWRTMNDAYKK